MAPAQCRQEGERGARCPLGPMAAPGRGFNSAVTVEFSSAPSSCGLATARVGIYSRSNATRSSTTSADIVGAFSSSDAHQLLLTSSDSHDGVHQKVCRDNSSLRWPCALPEVTLREVRRHALVEPCCVVCFALSRLCRSTAVYFLT